jgi:hypothetical protein
MIDVRRIVTPMLVALWLALSVFGLSRLWMFQQTAGAAAQAPTEWPAKTQLERHPALPTLVLFIHPQCPCSRATIEELNHLMATCHDKLTCTVLMIHPAETPTGWEHTDLWSSAAAIPGIKVISDPDGAESRRFGSMTSGQAMLFSPEGHLLFAGGITAARGHNGDNAGRSMITELVLDPHGHRAGNSNQTAVYGCPLFNRSPLGLNPGTRPCPD